MYKKQTVGKSKAYFRKKNKENYQKNKKLSSEYQIEKISGETYTQYKKRKNQQKL